MPCFLLLAGMLLACSSDAGKDGDAGGDASGGDVFTLPDQTASDSDSVLDGADGDQGQVEDDGGMEDGSATDTGVPTDTDTGDISGDDTAEPDASVDGTGNDVPVLCSSDGDCAFGEQWCVGGQCTECDNGGLTCRIRCPDGWGLYERNGCHACDCGPPNECASDEECTTDAGLGECYAGRHCWDWCPEGDPSCCLGNICSAPGCSENPRTGCTVRGCPVGEVCRLGIEFGCQPSGCSCNESGIWLCDRGCAGGTCHAPCETDADCTFGAEWCVQGACTACDNSGLSCRIACPDRWGLYERNGCHPCECAPPDECTTDADCPELDTGDPHCYPGRFCTDWCPAGDPSCCHGNICSMAGCPAGVDSPNISCWRRGCPAGQSCVAQGCASSGCGCRDLGDGPVWLCNADCIFASCVDDR